MNEIIFQATLLVNLWKTTPNKDWTKVYYNYYSMFIKENKRTFMFKSFYKLQQYNVCIICMNRKFHYEVLFCDE